MNDEKELTGIVSGACVGCFLLGGSIVGAIAVGVTEGYRLGVKECPGVTNVAGDQIINNSSSNLSPFSGNANGGKKNGK